MATVPDPLLKELHEADERFAELRRRLDGVEDLDLQSREKLATELREAERVTEEIRKRISASLKQDAEAAPPAAPPL